MNRVSRCYMDIRRSACPRRDTDAGTDSWVGEGRFLGVVTRTVLPVHFLGAESVHEAGLSSPDTRTCWGGT